MRGTHSRRCFPSWLASFQRRGHESSEPISSFVPSSPTFSCSTSVSGCLLWTAVAFVVVAGTQHRCVVQAMYCFCLRCRDIFLKSVHNTCVCTVWLFVVVVVQTAILIWDHVNYNITWINSQFSKYTFNYFVRNFSIILRKNLAVFAAGNNTTRSSTEKTKRSYNPHLITS